MRAKVLAFICMAFCSLPFPGCGRNVVQNPDPEKETEDPYALVEGGETVASIEAVKPVRIARVIGMPLKGETIPDPNTTLRRFGMGSTDFGNMWDAGNGSVLAVFGDNFNERGADWLSNALAVSTDRDMSDGLHYDSMIWDKSRGKRMEIISPSEEGCLSCIPTGGFSIQMPSSRRQFVNYMKIREWACGGDNDSWSVWGNGIAYSDDFGQTWTKSGLDWGAESNFAQVAYVVEDDFVYMFGTPSGRHGGVYLSRVAPASVLDKAAYSYWDGGAWSADEDDAVVIASGEISEMTVRYNSYYKRYMMMYLDIRERCLVYRDAAAPEGEWSAEKVLLSTTGPYVYYGPSIHPWFCDGRNLWFVVSQVSPVEGASYEWFHIYLYNAKLQEDGSGFNMIWEPGFELNPGKQLAWHTLWEFGPVSSTSDAHSGSVSCCLSNGTEGEMITACSQTIAVRKNREYLLSAWVKANASSSADAYIGVRQIGSAKASDSVEGWQRLEYSFNSGDLTSIDVYGSTLGHAGSSVLFDDFCLALKDEN